MGKFNLYNMLKQISGLDDNETAEEEVKTEVQENIKIDEPTPEAEFFKKPEPKKRFSAYRTVISRHEEANARIEKAERQRRVEINNES